MPISHDIPSFASLLQLCSTTKNLQKLRQLHAQTIKLNLSYNDFIRAKLVSAYASCAQMADAHFIFSRSNRHSTFLYNTLIRGYSSIKDFHLSLSSFRHMILTHKPIDPNTLPAVLKTVAGLSLLRLGISVHGSVLVNGFGSDLAHCNALITMYVKCGELSNARKVFDKMPERNLVTWCAMMCGYEMYGLFDEVFSLFRGILESGLSPDGAAFTIILASCSHGGLVEDGKKYFEMMKKFGLKPSVEHFTCMVDMLGRCGRIEEAKEMIEKMEIEPDEALWRVFLAVCRIHGQCGITVRGKCVEEKTRREFSRIETQHASLSGISS